MFNQRSKLVKEVLGTEKGQLLLSFLHNEYVRDRHPTSDTHMTYLHLGQKQLIEDLMDIVVGTDSMNHFKASSKLRDELDTLFEEQSDHE